MTAHRLAASVAIAAALAAALPATASADHARCPSGGRTIASNDHVRVWAVKRGDDTRHYGCARRVGRAFRLDPRGGELIAAPQTTKVAGYKVGYEAAYFDLRPYRVLVRDLRSGRLVHSATSNAQRSEIGHTGPATRLILKRNGSVAWTASVDCVCEGTDPAERGWEVHAIGTNGRRAVLDSGPEVDADSLRFVERGRKISWRHGGETRRATLR